MGYANHGSAESRSRGVLIGAAIIAAAFLFAGATSGQERPAPNADVSMLWREPADITSRDLFVGPGTSVTFDPAATYTWVKDDGSGYSPGYDVRTPDGMIWSVKLGKEAQPEIAASRILWAIGFHQPPTFYAEKWTLTGGVKAGPQGPARFRPELPDRKVVGEWSWSENPFAGTQAHRALLVANLILNNWDWKTSNNKIYDVTGDEGAVTRQYVVRDLGASLGKTSSPRVLRMFGWRGAQGSRNDVADFEQQGFIRGVTGNEVQFDYKGIYGSLVKTITPADVAWTAQLMSGLSDTQLDDAFRAAGYPEDVRRRYVAKIKSKIQEGLALASR